MKLIVIAGLLAGLGATPSLEELRQGSAVRDAAFRNLSGRVTFQVRKRLERSGPFKRLAQAMDMTIDAESRGRIDIIETHFDVDEENPGPTKGFKKTLVSTPEGMRGLHRTPDVGRLVGQIWSQPGLPWAEAPVEILFLGRYSASPWLQYTKANKVEEGERIDGHPTVRYSWTNSDDLIRGSFWIAPSLAWTPLRYEIEGRHEIKGAWKPSRRIEWSGVTKVGDLWLPAHIEKSQFINFPDGHSELWEEVTGQFSEWAVNRDLPASTFELDFPDKTLVMEPEKGLQYVKGSIDDPGIKKQVGQARSLVEEPKPKRGLEESLDRAVLETPPEEEPRSSTPFYVAGGVLCLAALAVGAWLWRGKVSGKAGAVRP